VWQRSHINGRTAEPRGGFQRQAKLTGWRECEGGHPRTGCQAYLFDSPRRPLARLLLEAFEALTAPNLKIQGGEPAPTGVMNNLQTDVVTGLNAEERGCLRIAAVTCNAFNDGVVSLSTSVEASRDASKHTAYTFSGNDAAGSGLILI